jgi:hypothetical protein
MFVWLYFPYIHVALEQQLLRSVAWVSIMKGSIDVLFLGVDQSWWPCNGAVKLLDLFTVPQLMFQEQN